MKESLLLDIFVHSSFFLFVAALIIPLLKKLRIPFVLGYLIVGIIFGPQGLGEFSSQLPLLKYITLQESDHVRVLSELGVVFLLFVIGLELTPQKLWRMRGLVLGLGSAQVVISSIVIGSVAYAWGNTVQASILLGLGLSLSSTAIIIHWLHEKKLFGSEAGQASFSVLLLQDLAVIPILLLIAIFGADADSSFLIIISELLLKIFLAIVGIVLLSKFCVRPIFSFSHKYGGSEVFVAVSFLIITISSVIAGLAGVSMALGAFIGGILLAESQYSYEISSLVTPFKSILIGIFFISFGMSIDLTYIAQKPIWLCLSVIGLMGIKSTIIYTLSRIWNLSKSAAAESALMLSQAGEFGLLVIGAAIAYGILGNSVGQFMFLTTGLTMFLTPFVTVASQKVGLLLRDRELEGTHKNDQIEGSNLSGHVIVMGWGRMGQTVTEMLAQQGITTVAFDKNAQVLELAREKNAKVYYADVTKKSVLKAAKIENASLVVLTIDNTSDARKVVQNIRGQHPHMPLVIRVHKLTDLSDFAEDRNTYIVPEYLSTSRLIAQEALGILGYIGD